MYSKSTKKKKEKKEKGKDRGEGVKVFQEQVIDCLCLAKKPEDWKTISVMRDGYYKWETAAGS